MIAYRWRAIGLLATLMLACGGCMSMGGGKIPSEVGEALDSPDEFTLYSIAPENLQSKEELAGKETFQGYLVVGKTVIKERATQKKLTEAFSRGVRDHDGSVAACFIPHHAIRVVSGKRTVDLVICFTCSQVYVYVDGKQGQSILISESPRKTFDDVLTRAGVPLGEKAKGNDK